MGLSSPFYTLGDWGPQKLHDAHSRRKDMQDRLKQVRMGEPRESYTPSVALPCGVFFFFNIYLFIYLAASGLSCDTRDLVTWPGIKPGPPAVGVRSLSHWTTREVSLWVLFEVSSLSLPDTQTHTHTQMDVAITLAAAQSGLLNPQFLFSFSTKEET